MKRKYGLMAAVAASLLGFGGFGATASQAGEIVFGVSAPLTGPRALLGKFFRQGVDLAVEEVNAEGGVLGETLVIAYEDDQADNPTAALNAMRKLMEVSKVPIVIGPHYSVTQFATMKTYCDGSLVSLTGASSVLLTSQDCNYVIRVRGDDSLQAQALVAHALDNMGVSKIGVISVNDDYGRSGSGSVIEILEQRGVTPVAVESHNTGDTDFSAPLSRFRDAGVELVIMWSHDNESALIVRQARQFGLDFKFAGSAFSQPTFIGLAGFAGEGAISAIDFIPADPNPTVQDFVARYTARYNESPELFAAAYYDAVKMAVQAVTQAGTTEASKVRAAFLDFQMKGVLADYRCEIKGDCNHQVHIVEIKDGAPQMITTVRF